MKSRILPLIAPLVLALAACGGPPPAADVLPTPVGPPLACRGARQLVEAPTPAGWEFLSVQYRELDAGGYRFCPHDGGQVAARIGRFGDLVVVQRLAPVTRGRQDIYFYRAGQLLAVQVRAGLDCPQWYGEELAGWQDLAPPTTNICLTEAQ